MQVGVSTPDFTNIRRYLHRAGGANGIDWLQWYRDATNCSALCRNSMLSGGLQYNPYPNTFAADPFYLKCLNGFNFSPLNGKRIQYVSQSGTMELDPELPEMNITDVKSCMRMIMSKLEKIIVPIFSVKNNLKLIEIKY